MKRPAPLRRSFGWRQSVIATWPITKGKTNMAIALDPAQHRLYVGCRNTDMHGAIVVIDTQTRKELDSLAIGGWVDYLAYDTKKKRVYASCGVGEVYAYEEQNNGRYRELPLTDTAVMAKTALFSPELDQLFARTRNHELSGCEHREDERG